MARRFSNASIFALLGSIGAHAVVAVWCLTAETPPATARRDEPLEFTLLAPVATTSPPALASAQQAHATEPAQQRVRQTPARAVQRKAAANDQEPVKEVEPASAPSSAETGETALAPRVQTAVDLSPLAAALTLRDVLTGRGRCEAITDAAACQEGGADAGARAGGTGSDIHAELATLRKELQLTPQRDGSYGFDGPSFRATIALDGRVRFDDKIQDLNTFVERHLVGVQINTSEKRRFMESTAALRERLATAAEAQNQRRGRVELQAALARVLAEPGVSLIEKRRTLFELWDDCAADSGGRAAQALIEGFIREHLPEGSALGYSAAELAQLNRGRISRHAFDPYAEADAGVRPG